MQKLKLQYFGHLKRRVDSLEKTLMLNDIRGKMEERDRMAREREAAALQARKQKKKKK